MPIPEHSADKELRVAVISHAPVGISETFIRAHIEQLPFRTLPGSGFGSRFRWEDEAPENPPLPEPQRWLNLLPRFLEFRLRRKYFAPPSEDEHMAARLRESAIDVVLAEYGTTAALLTPACRLAGIPLVAHFHGFDASRYQTLEEFAEPYREMFAYASTVVSVSDAMTKSLVEHGCPPEKILKNPYGPNERFFEIEPDYDSNTIVAVGRMTAKKAPYLTLEAFRRVADVEPSLCLMMLGDGDLMEVCERLLHAWQMEGSVILQGTSSPTEISEVMSQSFVFVQHSVTAKDGDSEGMPVAILEAGAAGLPVVATHHAGIPESVQDLETGFLSAPGDVQSMANNIVKLAKDRGKAREMGQLARERIARDFSMNCHLSTLEASLRKAVSPQTVDPTQSC